LLSLFTENDTNEHSKRAIGKSKFFLGVGGKNKKDKKTPKRRPEALPKHIFESRGQFLVYKGS
jgi:hypothetical protein